MLILFALSSLLFLFTIFIFILTEGLPLFYKVGVKNIVLGMKWAPTKGSFGIFPMIISSFMVTFGALIVGAPLALACAVYLSEYAGKKTKIVLKPSLELLAGIPSVVYGFLGVVYIVPFIREYLGGSGFSILVHLYRPGDNDPSDDHEHLLRLAHERARRLPGGLLRYGRDEMADGLQDRPSGRALRHPCELHTRHGKGDRGDDGRHNGRGKRPQDTDEPHSTRCGP